MTRHADQPLRFDDLAVGDEWESPRRTITEADVVAFAGVSGDFNPLHMDHEQARNGPFGRPIAHGLLGLAVVSGLASHSPRVDTLAFLGIVEWKFLRTLAFGDTVRVVSRVERIEPRSRNRRALVTWHKSLVNQEGKVLQEGFTQTLVRGLAGVGQDEPAAEA